MKKYKIKISVREIVEFVLKTGDINTVFLSSSRAVDGIKVHQKIQKKFAKEYKAYDVEAVIGHTVLIDGITIEITGRVDGIIHDGEIPIIDEIKSVGRDVMSIEEDNNLLHWAQGKMYAYMYAMAHSLDEIMVQLTYVELGSYTVKQFKKTFNLIELETFFMNIIQQYLVFAKKMAAYNEIKEESIQSLKFPFEDYRAGQRKLMTSVYKVIRDEEKLFARAPTGIGKTMGTIFPAVKSLMQHPAKIFYLTAKTIGRDVAEKSFDLLEENGLMLKRITITAKDKICLNDERKCDSSYCSYAKGHFDRINDALSALIDATHSYNREVIMAYAERFQVCPYELTLDLSLYCDCIICDYNYAFDPSIVLRRYFVEDNGWIFGEKCKIVFLIDEAHNLVDRARSMYSATLSKKAILELKKKLKGKDDSLHRYLTQMNQFMIEKRHACEDDGHVVEKNYSDEFVDLLRGVVYRTEKIFPQLVEWEHMDQLLEFYFGVYDFIRKVELYDERYVTYYEKIRDEVEMKIYCLDPSFNLKKYMDNAQAAVLFSATLTPMDYYAKILGGDEKNYGLTIESPFDPKNLCLIINNSISTKYKNREATYHKVVETITHAINGKKGNYIAFFPSYLYMEEVYQRFVETIDQEAVTAMIQERGLSEKEKEAFLETFQEESDQTLIAFAVLGGMFGEGIDLKGEKLSGAIIIGVGLPSIGLERDLIKQHFDQQSNNGFQYAYIYPGMNKVMQAAGRVIRTDKDIGLVVLIDERFGYNDYKGLFPLEWQHVKYLSNNASIQNHINAFWTLDKGE